MAATRVAPQIAPTAALVAIAWASASSARSASTSSSIRRKTPVEPLALAVAPAGRKDRRRADRRRAAGRPGRLAPAKPAVVAGSAAIRAGRARPIRRGRQFLPQERRCRRATPRPRPSPTRSCAPRSTGSRCAMRRRPARLDAFEKQHPDWPMSDWTKSVREGWLFSGKPSPAETQARLGDDAAAHRRRAPSRSRAPSWRRASATRRRRWCASLWRDRDLDAADRDRAAARVRRHADARRPSRAGEPARLCRTRRRRLARGGARRRRRASR